MAALPRLLGPIQPLYAILDPHTSKHERHGALRSSRSTSLSPTCAAGTDVQIFNAIITLVGSPYSLLPSETTTVADALTSMMYAPWNFSSQQGFESGIQPTISTSTPTCLCATAADFPVPDVTTCSENCQGWVDAGAGSTVAPETYLVQGAWTLAGGHLHVGCRLVAEGWRSAYWVYTATIRGRYRHICVQEQTSSSVLCV